ncbi:MAG TPA: sensor histidine kinase [Longimicrobium sp.]
MLVPGWLRLPPAAGPLPKGIGKSRKAMAGAERKGEHGPPRGLGTAEAAPAEAADAGTPGHAISPPAGAGEAAPEAAEADGVEREGGDAELVQALVDRHLTLMEQCRIQLERSAVAVQRSRMERERGWRDAGYPLPMGDQARSPTLAGRLIAAQEEERRRISLELHDAVSQRVAAVCISLRRLQYRLRDDAAAAGQLEQVLDVLGELVHGVRHMSHAMHPPVLELAGLGAALRGHCHELRTLARFEVEVAADDLPPVKPDAALCLFRVAQEALGNVLAHAGVKRATLAVAPLGEGLELVVSDRGIGFDPDLAAPGLGLVGMRERVWLLGGTFSVHSDPGEGTVIRAWIPLAEPEPEADDHDEAT